MFCLWRSPAGADFNATPIEREFLANEVVLQIPISEMIIFDDDINEATEGFVMVLETESSGTSSAEPLEGSDALEFTIFDNDSKFLLFIFQTIKTFIHNIIFIRYTDRI